MGIFIRRGKMKSIFIASIFLLLFPLKAIAEDPHTFTDQDLENYKSTGGTVVPQGEIPRTSDILHEINENQNKEWWCEKGEDYMKRIKNAKKDVEEAEEKLNKKRHDNFASYYKDSFGESMAEEDLKRAQRRLENCEDDFREFEDKAHRWNVPPGWLRCDFQ
jgi:hypothetical protein